MHDNNGRAQGLIPVDFDPFSSARVCALPLTPQQQELWFENQMGRDASCAYNQCFVLELHGPLSAASMRGALNQVVARHDALRATFDTDGTGQRIAPALGIELPVLDLAKAAPDERKAALDRIITQETTEPFDLAAGPLIRAKLVRESGGLHRLVLTAHHIVCDGWASAVLLSDMAKAYAADRFGLKAALPQRAAYQDYVLGEVAREANRDRQNGDVDYWIEQFADRVPVLDLPIDRTRAALRTHAGARGTIRIERPLYQQLRQLGAQHGCTLYVTLLTAFETLLHRLSGQRDFVLGIPIAGQAELENSHLVGHCVSTLPLRCRPDPSGTFAAELKRVRAAFLDAQSHQHVTFGSLLPKLAVERDPSRPPLVGITFNIDRIGAKFEFGDLELISIETPKRFVTFELGVNAIDSGQDLLVECDYNTDLFDPPTIERWLGHFKVLLGAAAEDATLRVRDMPLMTAAERDQALAGAQASFAETATLHELFARQARRKPDAVAACCDGATITYGELNSRANRLAHHLRTLGVVPDQVVGLCADRNNDMLVGLLAILKAGGAYLPLEPAYPKDRIAFMLEDAGCAVVVAGQEFAADFTGTSFALVTIEQTFDTSDADPTPVMSAENLAYVIYTSGSTGKPKGVLVSHANATRLFHATDAWFRFGPGDVWTLFHSYAFDFSVWEIFGALLHGGRLVVVPPFVTRDPAAFRKLLVEEKVTVLNQTPSAFRQLVQSDLGEPASDYALRTVVFGGEPLELHALRPWIERYGDARPELINMYGITETTVHVTYRQIRLSDIDGGKGSVIGKPIRDQFIRLLDPHGALVPAGVHGEIYVGGAGVARGYLNRPELTAQRFIADPYDGSGEGRLYRTGDLARRLADGDLEYLGRIDHQVKIRGFRIEPGEIEATLSRHASVRQCAVIAREDHPGDKRLVAYVTPASEAGIDTAALRTHLGRNLPAYMVPAAFVSLAQLPLTPSGKLDRKALPASDYAPKGASRAPRTPEEDILCSLFAETLGLDRVGVDEDFFALGGHSLLAIRLISRIRAALDVEIAIRTLFEAPSVDALAKRLGEADSARPALVATTRPAEIPLSFAQQRLWFLHWLEGSSATYVIPMALRLKGRLDVAALEAALGDLVERHESLRTIFPDTLGVPRQHILDAPAARPRLKAASVAPAFLGEALASAARRGFDLAQQPPLRVDLFAVGAEEHVLLLVLHHIAGDGWSMPPLVRDLSQAYAARCAGAAPVLPALPVQYADYALWQQRALGSESDPDSVAVRQLSYWTQALADLPDQIDLPTDRPRPLVASYVGDTVAVDIGAALHRGLLALARDSQATLFMVLQAGFAALLTRLGAGVDIPVGSPIAGRTDSALDDLIGVFINTLVLRTDTSGNPSFRELIARVRAVNLAAYTHQDLPFERLVEALNPTRSLARHPLFQVMLAIENNAEARFDLPGLIVAVEPVLIATAEFDLSLSLREQRARDGTAEGIKGSLEYSVDLFDRGSAEALAGRLVRLLEAAATAPDRPIGQLEILTAQERDQALAGAQASFAETATLHELFARQARRKPEAVAACCDGATITYGLLNSRANRLAHHLRTLGVVPDQVVGLCADRNIDMLVGLLAILKAGGAYLPLEPAYPKDRIAFMLEDAGCAVVVAGQEFAADFTGTSFALVTIEQTFDTSDADPTPVMSAENLAYVIYTSGSTGKPKGVLISHANATRLFHATDAWFRFGPGDVWALFATYAFDISVWEIFGALLHGGRLVVVPSFVTRDPAAFRKLLVEERVTVLNQTPSAFRMLEQSDLGEPASDYALRTVVFCGEALELHALRPWIERYGDARPELINMYGITETTMVNTYRPIRLADIDGGKGSVIGKPIPDQFIRLLDPHGALVPTGVPGEIYLGGAGVARGYLNRPELTAQRFIPDPYDGSGEGRLYRTGDLARRLADGDLEYLGRIDHQVKIRGFRIEPGEIEATLRKQPAIFNAMVAALEAGPGDLRLVAYVVFRSGEELTVSEVRGLLRRELPEHMIPSAVVPLPSMPLTANGKIDRSALPDPYRSGTRASVAHEPPEPGTEAWLAEIWREFLKIDGIGAEDNFFELGGHSLLAVRVAFAVEKKTGWRVDPRILFFQTLRQIASAIQRGPATGMDGLRV